MQRRRSVSHTFEEDIAAEKAKLEAQVAQGTGGPGLNATRADASAPVGDGQCQCRYISNCFMISSTQLAELPLLLLLRSSFRLGRRRRRFIFRRGRSQFRRRQAVTGPELCAFDRSDELAANRRARFYLHKRLSSDVGLLLRAALRERDV